MTVIVAPEVVPAAVEAERVNWPSCPGVTESVDGVAVTPAGSPLSEMLTGLLKPLTASVVTVKGMTWDLYPKKIHSCRVRVFMLIRVLLRSNKWIISVRLLTNDVYF